MTRLEYRCPWGHVWAAPWRKKAKPPRSTPCPSCRGGVYGELVRETKV